MAKQCLADAKYSFVATVELASYLVCVPVGKLPLAVLQELLLLFRQVVRSGGGGGGGRRRFLLLLAQLLLSHLFRRHF